jgi:hypothetical protein
MVGYVANHSPHTYKGFKYEPGKQEKLLLQGMSDGYIGIVQINQNQWIYHHFLQKLKD